MRRAVTVVALLIAASAMMWGQATIQSGSIQGTVTDPTDAVVVGARVTITSADTGQVRTFTTSSAGTYASGPLAPGTYTVRVEMAHFATSEMKTLVSVGNITPGNIKLGVGGEKQVVQVEATASQVNTEQTTVQGVITGKQMEELPMNGRNFLEAAQLEPGVQIQDGSNFDPTKIGFTAISVGGRQGRTTRIEVDGLDITDETVGTTTQNIPTNSIQEFQISQSSLDFSTELTSSGAVNIATKTGTNSYHGDLFYLFRDKRVGGANFPGGQDLPYQRNDAGFSFGAPIVRDKLFFFVAGERVLQHLFAPLTFSAPFNKYNGGFGSPFKDKQMTGRLDYNLKSSAKLFYRFTYDNFTALGNMVPNYEVIANLNNTPSHAAGLDFTTGSFTHSIRFGYLKFQNHIANGIAMSGALNLLPNAPADYRISSTSPQFRFGYNYLAPQATFQSDKQIKYDGSKMWRSHIFRFGMSFNKILGGGFANFWGMGPSVRSSRSATTVAGICTNTPADCPFAGGNSNPLNYPVTTIYLGNGQGYFTEKKEFGYPAGGQWDNRFQWYVGDSWKIKPNFTLTIGLRYNRDTGRTDSDMAAIPCSAINPANFDPMPPCTGNLIDNFGNIPGLGNPVRQPNSNFGGALGIAWDPWKNGKTVIRAGGGVYYENIIFNSVMFDRPVRLAKGLFNSISSNLCPSGQINFPGGQAVTSTPTGKDIATQVCYQPMGAVAADIVALQNSYQAAVAAAGTSANPNFVGETLQPDYGGGLYAPKFETPRSFQMNVGIQRELWRNGLLSVDYIRNVGLRFLVGVDTNHVGDARYLNKTAAANAINTMVSDCGVANVAAVVALAGSGGFCPAGASFYGSSDPADWWTPTIDDFASYGLDSGWGMFGGQPAEAYGTHPDSGAAFAGINPWYGSNTMQFPIGRSVYNALQVSFHQRASHLGRLVPNATFSVSYSLSRFESTSYDQDFVGAGNDNANPLRYFGPNGFDRTHQLSFGTVFTLPHGPRLSFVGHFNSPLPQDLRLQDQGRAGEIFHTDFTGDGTTGDILPGTNIGSFMRSVSPGGINKVISAYDNTYAGKLTPAGQALVNGGFFTQDQLVTLGAVMDSVPLAPVGEVGNGWLKVFDMKIAYPIKIKERVTIEPSFDVFNLFNFANFANSPNTLISGILTGDAGSANGTVYKDQGNRAGLGSGVFQVGAPRQMEFGIRLTF